MVSVSEDHVSSKREDTTKVPRTEETKVHGRTHGKSDHPIVPLKRGNLTHRDPVEGGG